MYKKLFKIFTKNGFMNNDNDIEAENEKRIT